MAGVTSTGLGSGLDINSIVTQLVAAEQKPTVARLDKKEAQLQAEISALGTVKAAFSDLRTSLTALRNANGLDKIAANSSDPSIFTASASSSVKSAAYAIEVKQLAQAQTQASQGFASADTVPIAAGATLTIDVGTSSKAITIAATDTLSDIMAAINTADAGVTASIVNDGGTDGYHLVLKSDTTGTANTITVTDSSTTFTFSEKQAAADAIVGINGIDVTSASNTISSAVDGLTFNLLQAKPGTSLSLSVAADSSSYTTAIKTMTDKYNALIDTIASVASYDPNTKQAGPLFSDGGVRMSIGQIKSILGQAISGLSGTVKTPHDVGFSTDSGGRLAFNPAKLSAALVIHKDDVITLFTDKPSGLVAKLDKALGGILDKNGILPSRNSGIQKSIKQIGEERVDLNKRLTAYQARLLSQFNSMDQVVGRLNSTGAWMTQQFNAMFNSQSKR